LTSSDEGDSEPLRRAAGRLWRDVHDDLAESLHTLHTIQRHPDLPSDLLGMIARTATRLGRAIGRLAELTEVTEGASPSGPASVDEPVGVPADRSAARPAGTAATLTLSPREQEVLLLLAEGLSNRGIADRLSVGAATAKSHVQRLLSKLRVTNRTQAVMAAARLGLLDPPG
jgi:DNA-binding CsgD family transcriptional regulator